VRVTSRLLGIGRATIHLPDKPGGVWQPETVELGDRESTGGDQLVDAAVEVAPDADNLLQRVESILPGGKFGLVAPAVLEEDEWAVRFEDAPDLGEGRGEIADRAEGEGGRDTVERVVRERQSALRIDPQPFDWHRGGGDAGSHP